MSREIVVRDTVSSTVLDRLAADASSYFHGSDWLRAWSAEGPPARQRVEIVALDQNSEVVARLGMASLRRRLHRRVPLPLSYWGMTGSGYGAADHLGPVGDSSAFDALVGAAIERSPHSTVLLESLDPAHEERLVHHGFRTLRHTACPRIDLSGIDDEKDLWPKKLLKELRRRERRMGEDGIRGRWILDPAEVLSALPSLQDVHLDRWSAQGGAGLFDGDRMALLRALLSGSESAFTPRMYVLETSEGIQASLLLLTCGDTMSSYKSGWRPGLHALAPGVAMHAAAIRQALAEGRSTYDFLRGTSGHKYTLRAVNRYDVTMIRGRGPTSTLLALRESAGGDTVDAPEVAASAT